MAKYREYIHPEKLKYRYYRNGKLTYYINIKMLKIDYPSEISGHHCNRGVQYLKQYT
jgi:hypothetical protein